MAEEVRSRWDITGMAINHRIGRLEVGETSLLVAVSAPHRREAFEACHYAVDRIKEIVPVWKKEVWEGGESWVEGHPVAASLANPAPAGLPVRQAGWPRSPLEKPERWRRNEGRSEPALGRMRGQLL